MASTAPIHAAVDEHIALHISSAAAATPEALDALGVTHVVNVSVNGPMPQRSTEPQYESMHIAIDDDLSAPLHEHLDAAADFIDAALSSGGRVCVFSANDQCAACAVAAFYLMRQHGHSLAEALGAMQARPNVGFWQRLIEAESWLRGAPPSMSIQKYRWAYLEASRPTEDRGALLQQLELGLQEVQALVHRHSFTPVQKNL